MAPYQGAFVVAQNLRWGICLAKPANRVPLATVSHLHLAAQIAHYPKLVRAHIVPVDKWGCNTSNRPRCEE